MRLIKIDAQNGGQRLDKFLMRYLNAAPKSFIYKMLRKKNIKLNGGRAQGNEILTEGNEVALYLSEETINAFFKPANAGISAPMPSVVYEDEHIIIVDKPCNLLTQSEKLGDVNLNDIILGYLAEKGDYNPIEQGAFKPGIVSRLDRNTSGLTLMGKDLPSQQQLSLAFKQHTVEKYYLALVHGRLDGEGKVDTHQKKLGGNRVELGLEGDRAVTLYRSIRYDEKADLTLTELKLITGRTHQIRAALSSIGHPIAGDVKYGGKRILGFKYQQLQAYKLVFHFNGGVLSYLDKKEFEVGAKLNTINLRKGRYNGAT